MPRTRINPPSRHAIRTHQQVADLLGCSREYVREHESKALRKLREAISGDEQLKEYFSDVLECGVRGRPTE